MFIVNCIAARVKAMDVDFIRISEPIMTFLELEKRAEKGDTKLFAKIETIWSKYQSDFDTSSFFAKFFLEEEKNELHEIYTRIQHIVFPPPSLPNEMLLRICSLLPLTELPSVALVCKAGCALARQARIDRARYFGGKVENFLEADLYLYKRFQDLSKGISTGKIPKRFVVKRGPILWSSVDLEESWRKILKRRPILFVKSKRINE